VSISAAQLRQQLKGRDRFQWTDISDKKFQGNPLGGSGVFK
jgi:hypothetical protein